MKILTGAPTSTSLKWAEEELLDELLPPFLRYIGRLPATLPAASSEPWPAWRFLALVPFRSGERLDKNEAAQEEHDPLHVHSTNGSSQGRAEHRRTENYEDEDLEESFALHDNGHTSSFRAFSQVQGEPSNLDDSFTWSELGHSETTSFLLESPIAQQNIPSKEEITDLRALPSVYELRRPTVATITKSVIVAVIDISPPRTVTVRKGRTQPVAMDIVELFVKDETKSGLKITIWLDHKPKSGSYLDHSRQLHKSVACLRRGDVVFIKNLGLRQYRGEVLGQSLRGWKYPSNGTKITLLSRRELEAGTELENLPMVHAKKIERVQRWLSDFLGPSFTTIAGEMDLIKRPGARKRRKVQTEELPPDTQSE
ncbi:MAG: hypothetical protein M1820_000290 [Bogoriella megaspora]|nr:MAG: hypothetical protein M1820_000290 [Bogoriella megaspora]